MMIGAIQHRSRIGLAPARSQGGFDIKILLFLGLIGFLLFWSFWGRSIEMRLYGTSPNHRSWNDLGIQIADIPPGSRGSGVAVKITDPNAPAGQAGLRSGDIIIGLDGRLVSSVETVRHIIASKGGGRPLKITVNRNGNRRDVYLRLGEPLPEDPILRKSVLKDQFTATPERIFIMAVFLKMSVVLFYLLYRNMVDRTAIVLMIAAAVILLGIFFDRYSPMDALFAIKFNTISLLVGMGIISAVLSESGFFVYIAHRVGRRAGQNLLGVFVLFCLITFFFSMLVNNLTTILIMVPITLKLGAILGFDPKPFIIGEIISSNLGGASTMVGDFPNMLISTQAGIGFGEFIIFMMPICLVLLGLLLIYLRPSIRCLAVSRSKADGALRNQLPLPVFDPQKRRALRRAGFVLVHVIFLFIISGRITLNPSAIALFGGLSLFLFSGVDRRKILKIVGFNDILFFIGLFVVVGGLEAGGLLQYLSQLLTTLSFGKPWLLCLIMMWLAAAITSFLNAGPTTVLFFPIVLGFTLALPAQIMWWALSLGVLAGSSATIFGATAGPVAAGLVENFAAKDQLGSSATNTITFKEFARIGVPVMLLFLAVSSVYITYLYFYQWN